jgi:hypothetical protein
MPGFMHTTGLRMTRVTGSRSRLKRLTGSGGRKGTHLASSIAW